METLELRVGDITLRQFTVEDAEAIFALIDGNRDHLSQNGDETAGKYPTEESVLESIQNPRNPKKLRFGIWVNESFTGSINLTPDESGRMEVGYYLGSEFQKRGYMIRSLNAIVEYAFERGVSEVYANVNINNQQSANVLEKAGFARVSHSDHLVYSKFRSS